MSENLLHKKNMEEIKKALVDDGFRIIERKNKDYFNFEKNNQFGYFQKDMVGVSLSSSYRPSKENGSGASYLKNVGNVTLDSFNNALNYIVQGSHNVSFYKNIQDFLANDFFIFESSVLSKDGTKPAIAYLDGYYIYTSVTHAPVINKVHRYLWNNFYEKEDKNVKKVIFQLENGELKAKNHNINLFRDGGLMQAFRNRILGQEPDIDAAEKKLFAAAAMKSNAALKEAKEFAKEVKSRANAEIVILNKVSELNDETLNIKEDIAEAEDVSTAPKL